jgi:predicted amidohydrolase YtcJ
MRFLFLCLLLGITTSRAGLAQSADIIISGARVWTGDSTQPSAQAVALAGDKILAVGTTAAVMRHRGPATRVITSPGRFIAPGFIDNHTHFQNAGALLVGVNLLDVSSEAALVRRVREARDRLPKGAWLTGGDWGAYEAWAQGSTGAAGQRAAQAFSPHRAMIDSLTPETPVLISKWDRTAHMANSRALTLAGIQCGAEGVECESGQPTGRLTTAAANRVRRVIPAKSLDQRLVESRAALAHLRALGVTTIHDNTGPEQMEVYQELKRRGELTLRVYMRPTMDKCPQLRAVGIRHGFGDEWLKIGGLKGFVDGIMGNSSAYFYEPYLTSGERGQWRTMLTDPPGMEPLLFCADSAGHWPQVHAAHHDGESDARERPQGAPLARHPHAGDPWPRRRDPHGPTRRDGRGAAVPCDRRHAMDGTAHRPAFALGVCVQDAPERWCPDVVRQRLAGHERRVVYG